MKNKFFLKISLILCCVSYCLACPVFSAFATSTNDSGKDVLDDTRYSAIGIGDIVDLIQFIYDLNDGEMPPSIAEGDYWIQKFAEKSAELATQDTVEDAKTIYTAPNYEPYTIGDSYAIMGKRRINYPYNDWYEIDYIYIYVNKNVSVQPQQFGNYTIAPNTIFMIRQTNFDGVKSFSIPIAENGLSVQTGSSPSGIPVSIKFSGNATNTFIYDDETGRQTIGFRHSGNDFSPVRLNIINNSVNTIVDNHLVDYYTTNQSDYVSYIGNNRYLNNFEAFVGTGYDYNNSYGIMGGSFRPFYITTAFFNTSGYDEDDVNPTYINNYFTTDPNNVDPSKPPAYVFPQNNPLASGNTIDNSSINNYGDYGITLLDGELHIDPDILAGALGALVDPDFVGAVGGVFGLQPEIGLGFDTPLILDLPELVGDYLDSITIYPPSPPWEPPTYPPVNTQPIITATLPQYSIQTFPVAVGQIVGDTLNTGWDIFDTLGILACLIPSIFVIIFWRFTGK